MVKARNGDGRMTGWLAAMAGKLFNHVDKRVGFIQSTEEVTVLLRLHSTDGGDKLFGVVFIVLHDGILQEDKAVAALLVKAIDRNGLVGAWLCSRRSHRLLKDANDVIGSVVGFQVTQKDGAKGRASSDCSIVATRSSCICSFSSGISTGGVINSCSRFFLWCFPSWRSVGGSWFVLCVAHGDWLSFCGDVEGDARAACTRLNDPYNGRTSICSSSSNESTAMFIYFFLV